MSFCNKAIDLLFLKGHQNVNFFVLIKNELLPDKVFITLEKRVFLNVKKYLTIRYKGERNHEWTLNKTCILFFSCKFFKLSFLFKNDYIKKRKGSFSFIIDTKKQQQQKNMK